jgi:DNA-binding Lrp family transcriptional regulator
MPKHVLSSHNGDGRDDSDDETVGSSMIGGTGWKKRLVRLAEEHEEKARAIRLTLAIMADAAKVTKQTGHATVLAKALAAESARTTARGPRSESKGAQIVPYLMAHGPSHVGAITKALGFSRTGIGNKLGELVTAGTVTRISAGIYAATAVPAQTSEGKSSHAAIRARRAKSAKLLQAIADASAPVPSEMLAQLTDASSRAIGTLLRSGYVKKTKEGYTRTAKPFDVDAV